MSIPWLRSCIACACASGYEPALSSSSVSFSSFFSSLVDFLLSLSLSSPTLMMGVLSLSV